MKNIVRSLFYFKPGVLLRKEYGIVCIFNNSVNLLFYLLGGSLVNYKNYLLRLIAVILCIPLLSNHIKKLFPHKYPYYDYAVATFTLPFFFTFMMIKNNFSYIWLISFFLCILMMLSIFNFYEMIISLVVGIIFSTLILVLITKHNFKFFHGNITLGSAFSSIGYAIVIGCFLMERKNRLQKNRVKETGLLMSSGIAHELRTSLRSIELNASLLQKYLSFSTSCMSPQERKVDVKKMVERIREEVNASFIVMDRILTIFKFQKTPQVKWERCSTNQIIKEAVESYSFSSQERSLVKWEIGKDFIYWGDPILTKHILYNLIKNSLYFIKNASKGNIYIKTSQYSLSSFQISFKDTGQGIKEGDLPYIFDYEFSQTPYGFGIGLGFCKDVIKLMGGKIVCNSIFREYTEFIITLPLLKMDSVKIKERS